MPQFNELPKTQKILSLSIVGAFLLVGTKFGVLEPIRVYQKLKIETEQAQTRLENLQKINTVTKHQLVRGPSSISTDAKSITWKRSDLMTVINEWTDKNREIKITKITSMIDEANPEKKPQFEIEMEGSFKGVGSLLERLETTPLLVRTVAMNRMGEDLRKCGAKITVEEPLAKPDGEPK